jgi:16S rRNA U516 pseudouridylate synthase RsuA-like enzyme
VAVCRITLFEGRYHQLRRMLAAIGNKAISIHRVQTGPIEIGDLKVRLVSHHFCRLVSMLTYLPLPGRTLA